MTPVSKFETGSFVARNTACDPTILTVNAEERGPNTAQICRTLRMSVKASKTHAEAPCENKAGSLFPAVSKPINWFKSP